MDSLNPVQFIDTVKTGNHIVLFYEELEYARMLEFRFLGNGLARGEPAIYVSNEDPAFIENEMEGSGIDVRSVKKNNLLRILNITDLLKDGPMDAQKFWDRITAGLQPPLRVVTRPIYAMNTVDGILAELEVERHFQAKFADLGCALVCLYDVMEIEDIRRGKWMAELLKIHHGAIFAPSLGKGLGYYNEQP